MKTRLLTYLSLGAIIVATPVMAQNFMAGGVGAEASQELGGFGLENMAVDFGGWDASSENLDANMNAFFGEGAVQSSTQQTITESYNEASGNTKTGAYKKSSGKKVQETDHIYKALIHFGDEDVNVSGRKVQARGGNVAAEATALGAFLAKRGVKADAVIIQNDKGGAHKHVTVYRHVVKHKAAHKAARHAAPRAVRAKEARR